MFCVALCHSLAAPRCRFVQCLKKCTVPLCLWIMLQVQTPRTIRQALTRLLWTLSPRPVRGKEKTIQPLHYFPQGLVRELPIHWFLPEMPTAVRPKWSGSLVFHLSIPRGWWETKDGAGYLLLSQVIQQGAASISTRILIWDTATESGCLSATWLILIQTVCLILGTGQLLGF